MKQIFKKNTMSLIFLSSLTAMAERYESSHAIDTENTVSVDDHFQSWSQEDVLKDKAKDVGAKVAVSGVAAMAALLTSIEVDQYIFDLRKKLEAEEEILEKRKKYHAKNKTSDSSQALDEIKKSEIRIAKLKKSKLLSNLSSKMAASAGIYFVVNATSGLVVAAFDKKPLYFMNAPHLAVYLSDLKDPKNKAKMTKIDPLLAKKELQELLAKPIIQD